MTDCPTCHGPVHRDMAGPYWTTARRRATAAINRTRNAINRIEGR